MCGTSFFTTFGGTSGRGATNPPLIKMAFQNNVMIKSNDWYHKPGNRASWSRTSNRAILNRIKRNV